MDTARDRLTEVAIDSFSAYCPSNKTKLTLYRTSRQPWLLCTSQPQSIRFLAPSELTLGPQAVYTIDLGYSLSVQTGYRCRLETTTELSGQTTFYVQTKTICTAGRSQYVPLSLSVSNWGSSSASINRGTALANLFVEPAYSIESIVFSTSSVVGKERPQNTKRPTVPTVLPTSSAFTDRASSSLAQSSKPIGKATSSSVTEHEYSEIYHSSTQEDKIQSSAKTEFDPTVKPPRPMSYYNRSTDQI